MTVATRRAVLAGALAVAGAARAASTRGGFRNVLSVGLGAEAILAQGVRFTDGARTARTVADLQRLFVAHGATEVYTRIGTSRTGAFEPANSLARALSRAQLAKSLGLALDPEIGLWRAYGGMPDFSEYPDLQPPRPWNTLSLAEMLPRAQAFAAAVARAVLATGVRVNVWHLSGDERGIGGVTMPRLGPFGRETPYLAPDGVDPEIGRIDVTAFERPSQAERADWYERHLWPHTGRLFAALADGVRSVDPNARFTTHLGSGSRPAYEPQLMIRFFKALARAGYRVYQPGACFFPSSAAEPADRLAAFKATIEQAYAALGRPVFIAEHAYPVKPMSIGDDWGHATTGYPLSAEGQANLTRDLVSWGARTGRLAGIRQWSPDAAAGGWAPMSMFEMHDQIAIARPSLDAVRQGLT